MEGHFTYKRQLVWAVLDEQLLTLYDEINLQSGIVVGFKRAFEVKNAKIIKRSSESSKFCIAVEIPSMWRTNIVELEFRDEASLSRWHTALVRASDLHNEDARKLVLLENYCMALGINRRLSSPTKRIVTTAYRKICITAHPDKGGSAEAFSRINDAYAELLAYASEQEPATTVTYEAVIEKTGGGVGLGIGVAEGRFHRSVLVSKVDDYIKLRGLSEGAAGAIRPGDSLIAIDRDDCSRWLLSRVRARLNNLRVPMGSTVVFTFERRNPLEVSSSSHETSNAHSHSHSHHRTEGGATAELPVRHNDHNHRFDVGRERAHTEPALHVAGAGHPHSSSSFSSSRSVGASGILSGLFAFTRAFSPEKILANSRHIPAAAMFSSSPESPAAGEASSFASSSFHPGNSDLNLSVLNRLDASSSSSQHHQPSQYQQGQESESSIAYLQSEIEVYQEKEVSWMQEMDVLHEELRTYREDNKELLDKLLYSIKKGEALAATNDLLLVEIAKLKGEKERSVARDRGAHNSISSKDVNTSSSSNGSPALEGLKSTSGRGASRPRSNSNSRGYAHAMKSSSVGEQGQQRRKSDAARKDTRMDSSSSSSILNRSSSMSSPSPADDDDKFPHTSRIVGGTYAAVEERSSKLEERLAFLLKTATELIDEGQKA